MVGRKRKAKKVNASSNGKEDDACLETTGDEKQYPQTNQDSSDVEAMNSENAMPSNPNSSPQRKRVHSKSKDVVATRRSSRIRSSSLINGAHKVEPSVEHVIDLDDREEKEEASDHQQEITLPVFSEKGDLEEEQPRIADSRILEEKVDYIVGVVDDLVSKNFKQAARRQNLSPSTDYGYKSLYIAAQKKIEALMEQNYELVRQLEFARGKLDVYEKMHNAMSASKEVVLVSRLEKDAEAKTLSPQTVEEAVPDVRCVSPKQKKNNYRKKKVLFEGK